MLSLNDMPPEDPIKLWQHVHGASVHFALALSLVSIAFDLGSKLFGKKEWRTVGFWALVVATLLSLPSLLSGFWGQLGWFKAEPWTADHLLQHRNLGIIGTVVLVVLLAWRSGTGDFGIARHSHDRRKDTQYVLYLLLALVGAGIMGYTAYMGAYVARGY